MIFFFNRTTPPDEGDERFYDPKELGELGLQGSVLDYYKLKFGPEWASHYFFDKMMNSVEFWDLENENHCDIDWEEGDDDQEGEEESAE